MRLPDFGAFEPFLRLRQAMGAEQLGQFEFFDPVRHLTADERAQLLDRGVEVARAQLRKLLDHTIGFKNARVILWQETGALTRCYHLCWCDQLPEAGQLWIGAGLPARQPAQVCAACLDHLQYDGHNSLRHRHQAYYEKVRQEFSLADFFLRYPHYPLREP